jgi:hypothetical protein
VAARSQALAAGQRAGLDRLLRRLVPAAEHRRLPQASDLPIDRFVQNFQISDEQLSATRYLAKLTVAFSPTAIRDLLQTQGVPFSQVASAPQVVLPFYDDLVEPRLWQDGNPWWLAWDQAMDRERLFRLTLPLGDLEDLSTVTVPQVQAGDAAALGRLAQRYGAESVLIMSAAPVPAPTPGAPPTFRIESRQAGEAVPVVAPFEVTGAAGEAFEAVLAQAVRQLQDRLDESWKSRHQLRLDQGGFLFVNVPIGDLQDWTSIDQGLAGLEEISQVEVTSFARNRVQAEIHYVGDQISLEQALARLGLSLSQEGESWLLQPTAIQPPQGAPPNGTSTPS